MCHVGFTPLEDRTNGRSESVHSYLRNEHDDRDACFTSRVSFEYFNIKMGQESGLNFVPRPVSFSNTLSQDLKICSERMARQRKQMTLQQIRTEIQTPLMKERSAGGDVGGGETQVKTQESRGTWLAAETPGNRAELTRPMRNRCPEKKKQECERPHPYRSTRGQRSTMNRRGKTNKQTNK